MSDYFRIKKGKVKDMVQAGDIIEHKRDDNTKEDAVLFPAQQRLSSVYVEAGDKMIYKYPDGSTETVILKVVKDKTNSDVTGFLYATIKDGDDIIVAINNQVIPRKGAIEITPVNPRPPVRERFVEVLQYELSNFDMKLAAINGLLLDVTYLKYKG